VTLLSPSTKVDGSSESDSDSD